MNVDKIVIREDEIRKTFNSDKYNAFAHQFIYTDKFDKFLIPDEMEVAFLHGDVTTEKNEFFCSFDVGEYNVYTENALGPFAQNGRDKGEYIKSKCIKFYFPISKTEKYKMFLEIIKLSRDDCPDGFTAESSTFTIYLNEKGDKKEDIISGEACLTDNPNLGNLCLGHLLVRNAFLLMTVFCEIQQRALQKKEKIQRARNFFVTNTSEKREKQNQNYTVHLGKGMQFVYEPSNVHREFTRHCEAWNVRGHYRQYKSGKTIFIHPYTKGKGRLNQKEYIV